MVKKNIFSDDSQKPKVTKKNVVKKVQKNVFNDVEISSRDDIKELVKQEFNSLVIKELTYEQQLFLQDYVKGMPEADLRRKHNLSLNQFNELVSNPVFQTKARDELYGNTYANKDVNLRLNNQLIEMYSQALTPEKIAEIAPDKLGMLLLKHMEFVHKSTQDNKVEIKVDVTTLINKNVREKRIEEVDGKVKVKSKYPILEDGKIVDSWNFEEEK